MNNLIYTIALDRPGVSEFSIMARMLVLSLRYAGYAGDILVFTNQSGGLFKFGRSGVEEVYVDTSDLIDAEIRSLAKTLKFRGRDSIGRCYDNVLFLDCDTLALGDIDRLFSSKKLVTGAYETWGKISNDAFCAYLSDEEMLSCVSPPINSGTFRVRGSAYHEIMERWERVYLTPRVRSSGCDDQPAWVRLLLDLGEEADYWEQSNLVRFPLAESIHCASEQTASIYHYVGLSGVARLKHMIADYYRLFQPELILGLAGTVDQ